MLHCFRPAIAAFSLTAIAALVTGCGPHGSSAFQPVLRQSQRLPEMSQPGNSVGTSTISYRNNCILAPASPDPNAPTIVDCYIPGYQATISQDWQIELYDWDDPGDAITCGQTTVSSTVAGVAPGVVSASAAPSTIACPNPPATIAAVGEVNANPKDGAQNATVTFTVNTAVTDPTDNVKDYPEQIQFVMNLHIGQCAPPSSATSLPAASLPRKHRSDPRNVRRPQVGVHTEVADIFVNPIITESAPTCELIPAQGATLITKQYPDGAPKYAFEDPGAAGGIGIASAHREPAASRRTESNIVIRCLDPDWRVDVSSDGIVHITAHPQCPPPATVRQATLTVTRYDFNAQDTTLGVPELYPKDCTQSCDIDLSLAADRSQLTQYKPHIDYQLGQRVYPTTPQQDEAASFVVPYNSLGATYPQYHDTRFALQPDGKPLVPFPKTPPIIQKCPPQGQRRSQSGCHERNDQGDFRKELIREYAARGWDRAILRQRPLEAHHIQELQWGGDNDVSYNGVLLLESIHREYSVWWRSLF